MASDLETNLINGGISPAAAKILANAIANTASVRTDIGGRLGDVTPTAQLRLVDADTRRYLLPTLDQPAKDTRRSGQYSPKDSRHPYEESQPARPQGTLATPSVKGGDYINVSAATSGGVAQTTVSLRITASPGRHARLNQGGKSVEAVPFSVENDQEQFVEAAFEERPNATVLRIRLKNVKKFVDKNGAQFYGWAAE
jgi:hypothetical protein